MYFGATDMWNETQQTYGRWQWAAGLVLGLVLFGGCDPQVDPNGEPNGNPNGDQDISASPEVEPNGSFATATPITFDDDNRARATGSLPELVDAEAYDVDYFALGKLEPGDRVTIDVNTPADTPDAPLNTVAGVFDREGFVVMINDDEAAENDELDPKVAGQIAHDSEGYFLILTRAAGAGPVGGDYEVVVTLERGGDAPATQAQTVFLDYRGGTVTGPAVGTLTLPAFDPSDIDAAYAGQADVVKANILATMRQNYARWNLTVLTSDTDAPPADGTCSTVYFGGSYPDSLGMALAGTDFNNGDPADDAVIFTGRFTDDLFTERPDAAQLGTAIGNVASHEVGHLLGLSHVANSLGLMNAYDAPDNYLGDLQFTSSFLHITLFPVADPDLSFLSQDAPRILTETLGRAPAAQDVVVDAVEKVTALAGGDFNSNGRVDFVAGSVESYEFNLLVNEGGGVFSSPGVTSDFSATADLLATDLTGDGHADLLLADFGFTAVYTYVNLGDGRGLEYRGEYPVSYGPWAMAAADLDGDRVADLVVAHPTDNRVSWLPGIGDASFGTGRDLGVASLPYAVAAGDLDGDGDNDVAVACTGTVDDLESGGAWVFVNDGNGNFAPLDPPNLAGASITRDIGIADVNADGRNDLILADMGTSNAVVLINQGSLSFAEPARYLSGEVPTSLVMVDLDDDNDLDLALANEGTSDVSVLLNRGDGTFAPHWPYGVGDAPGRVFAADFDNDGDVDLASADKGDGTISILFNHGDGTFGR